MTPSFPMAGSTVGCMVTIHIPCITTHIATIRILHTTHTTVTTTSFIETITTIEPNTTIMGTPTLHQHTMLAGLVLPTTFPIQIPATAPLKTHLHKTIQAPATNGGILETVTEVAAHQGPLVLLAPLVAQDLEVPVLEVPHQETATEVLPVVQMAVLEEDKF